MESENRLGEDKKISRRNYLKYAGGAIVAATAAGAGIYYYTTPPGPTPPTPTTTIAPTTTYTKPTTATLAKEVHFRSLAYAGLAMGDPIAQAVKREANAVIDYELSDFATYAQVSVNRGMEYDFVHMWTAIGRPLFESNVPQPVPKEGIPRWDDMAPLLTKTEEFLGGIDYGEAMAADIKKDIWWKGQDGKQFVCVITEMGLDCMGYNPEFIDTKGGTESDPDVDTYGAILDPQYKGKTTIADIGTATIPLFAIYLSKNGMMDKPEDIDNLKRNEIDKVVDFLIPHKKRGQFKTLWPDFGTGTNLAVSREIWLGDLWAGITMAVRQAGVPFNYVIPKEGGMYWQTGDVLTKKVQGDLIPVAEKAINAKLSGEIGQYWAYMNYQFPGYKQKSALDYMGPELYGWCYEGRRTYKPLSETVWKDKPSRIASGLFDPAKYEWSKQPGTENPQGHKRYTGTMENYFRSMSVYETWLSEAAYYNEAWQRFKSA